MGSPFFRAQGRIRKLAALLHAPCAASREKISSTRLHVYPHSRNKKIRIMLKSSELVDCKSFLRITKPLFYETAFKSLDIRLFLQKQGFSVPQILFTKDGCPYVKISGAEGKCYYVLYEFIEGEEADPEQDAEPIEAVIGKLHAVMKEYPGSLIKRDKHFYIGRYIDIMYAKQYDKVEEFIAYGYVLKTPELNCFIRASLGTGHI